MLAFPKKSPFNKKVYGVVEALVSVGYEYKRGATCGADSAIWATRRVQVRGFDVDISDIGGWNLDIHHHYNSDQGRGGKDFIPCL